MVESCFLSHEKKTRQEVHEELSDHLVRGYRARKRSVGRPSTTSDHELRFQNVGTHLPAYSSERKGCVLCKENVKKNKGGKIGHIDRHAAGVHVSYIKCDMCNAHLCLNKDRNCFALWHTRVQYVIRMIEQILHKDEKCL